MAFIVEMWGMPVPKELEAVRKNRFFQCHASFWKEVLRLGRENGWQPMGTLPADQFSLKMCIKHGKVDASYEPDEHAFAKAVVAKDASAWAAALEKALNTVGVEKSESEKNWPKLLRDDMTQDDFIAANRGLTKEHIQEFIGFLKKGEFGFAWDD